MQQVVKIPKVNRHIFDNIRTEEEELEADMDNVDKSSTRKKIRRLESKKAFLNDPRFEEMFTNKVSAPLSNLFLS
jgi:ribosome biogenesis protein ENP2